MRNVLAVLLAALAAISGASAWGGWVVDKTLTQPETVQSTLGPLIDDPGVRAMVSTRVKAQVIERLPGGVVPKKAEKVVGAAVTKATNSVLDDQEVRAAWLEALDESRKLYVHRVREEGASAGRIEIVLDPIANLAAKHITDALSGIGLKIKAPPTASWRLDEDISDVSPLASLVVPGTQLVVNQSQYWLGYAIASAVLMLLALLAALRKAVAVITAGVVAGVAGLVGVWLAGIVSSVAGGGNNAVMQSAGSAISELIRGTSYPVALTGGGLILFGIVMLIIGGVRRRRRSVDYEL